MLSAFWTCAVLPALCYDTFLDMSLEAFETRGWFMPAIASYTTIDK
jgi:hypothetical protein